ncbi:MAG: hypothetical protein Q7S74_05615 [Nanoarchaeota archaeon]|nr:hypothetical protein [Nanoarchaeota archaeon]
MISKNAVKEIAKKISSKKISKDTFIKIDKMIEERVTKIISDASRKADFEGRVVIKGRDIETEK